MDRNRGRSALSGIVRHIPLILCLVAAGLVALQFVFAVRYFNDSFPHQSKYADSRAYLKLADGKKVALVRAVMYPLILRQLARISRPDLFALAYSVQLVATFVASLYFCLGLLVSGPTGSINRHQPRFWLFFLLPVAMLVDPLSLHFDLSLMPDSLTSSTALIFIGSLVFIWSRPGGRYRLLHILVCLISFITLTLLRLEKPIVVSLVLVIMFLFCLVMFFRHRDRGTQARCMILLVFILVVGHVADTVILRQVPRHKSEYESMRNVRLVAANRLALEVLGKIYDHLSEETRQYVTPEVADGFIANRRNFNDFMIPILRSDPEDGRKILDDMIWTTLAREGWPVAKYMMEDLCLYLGAPIAFHYQLAFKARRRYFTMWTLENIKYQVRPRTKPTGYVDHYLRISRVLLICVLAGVFAVCVGRRKGRGGIPPSVTAVLIVLLFHCVNSLFFGFLTSRFHMRYAMPSYRLLMLTSYFVLFAYVSRVEHSTKEPC